MGEALLAGDEVAGGRGGAGQSATDGGESRGGRAVGAALERRVDESQFGADGREETLPLIRMEIDGLGVDIAVFALDDLRRTPLSPQDGRPYRRLNLAAAEALAAD